MRTKSRKAWLKLCFTILTVLPLSLQAGPEDEALAALEASIGWVLTADAEFGVVSGSDGSGESCSIFGD